ncbi:MAG: prefoldin subunit alpha [Thermoplasmatota archaeon]
MNDAAFQATQRQLQAMDQQLASMESTLSQWNQAVETLSGLEGEQTGLVPIGGGVRIRATLHDAPVLLDVGAGYAKELSIAEAKEQLLDQIGTLKANFRTASEDAQMLAERLQSLAQAEAEAEDS